MEAEHPKPRKKISIRRILVLFIYAFVSIMVIGDLGIRYERIAAVRDFIRMDANKPRLTALQDHSRQPFKTYVPVNAFGWTLALPETAIKMHRESKGQLIYQFDSGSSLIVLNKQSSDTLRRAEMNRLVSAGTLLPTDSSSLYAFQRAGLTEDSRTPMHFWQSSRIFQRKLYFLMTALAIPARSTAAYDVSAGTCRGFEFVRPMGSHTGFVVDLYDHLDNSIEIIYTSTQPHPQATLNSLLDSVQPPV